jgi:hypothetical protein
MALEKFHYTIGKHEVTLPNFGNLPFGLVRKTRHMPDDERFFAMLEILLGEDSADMAAVDTLGTAEMNEFIEAWQKHSGVSLGESSAS